MRNQPQQTPSPEAADQAAARDRVLEAAATQIDLAVQDAGGPVDALGAAIARMSAQLRGQDPQAVDLQQLRRDVGLCIENLQVFDRLTQHLTLIGGVLRDVEAGPGDAAAWVQAHQRLADTGSGGVEMF